MNFFGFGNGTNNSCNEGGNNCLCTIVLLMLLCNGCGGSGLSLGGGGCDCCSLILWLIVLSCLCGGGNNCGN